MLFSVLLRIIKSTLKQVDLHNLLCFATLKAALICKIVAEHLTHYFKL